MKRTCYCPPWDLRGMRRPFRWLPLAFLRWLHRRTGHHCMPKWLAERDNYIDWRGHYVFYDRMVAQAWHRANQAQESITELRREILRLKNVRGIDWP